MKRSMRFLTTVLTAIMLLAVLASCGASDMAGNDNRYMDKSSGTEVSAPSVGGDKGWNGVYGKGEPGEDMSMPDGETRADFEEKLIKTVRLEAETKEYDAALKALDEMISEVGVVWPTPEIIIGEMPLIPFESPQQSWRSLWCRRQAFSM